MVGYTQLLRLKVAPSDYCSFKIENLKMRSDFKLNAEKRRIREQPRLVNVMLNVGFDAIIANSTK